MAHELLSLMNVGKATLNDLKLLGINTIHDLKDKNPQELYKTLEKITGKRHDICMLDVFAAIIHEAKTGEKRPWHYYSKIRKNYGKKL